MRRWRTDRVTALVEAAIMIPILLLIAAGIFEFGRAYQTLAGSNECGPGGRAHVGLAQR